MSQERLDHLMSAWQERQRQGRDVPAAELCRDHPELLPELERRIRALRQMNDLAGRAAETLPPAAPPAEAPTPQPVYVAALADDPDGTRQGAGSTVPRMSARADAVNIPGYEILATLGRGGMGVVYQARQTKLGRVVALKMILSGAHAGPDELARFRTEAEAIARLQHPNIVQVFEVGEQGGLPFFSLEFCGGGSLEKKLGGRPLPPREAAGLVEVLARAMAVAHDKGVIHRDLKPANVLLAEDGTPKITDFGLAKHDDAGMTATGAVLGTPCYMAPEQAVGRSRSVGPAADVYALGTILYECLTGRPPFNGASSWDILQMVASADPVPPARLQPTVPRDLETVCLKCLEKEPARRYATALELAEDLGRFLAGRPVRARPLGWAEQSWRSARRHPARAALAVAVLVLVLAGAAGGLWLSQERLRLRLAAESDLSAAARLLGESRWSEAREALGRADARLGAGGPGDLRLRLEQMGRDLGLVARLDAVRLAWATVTEGRQFDTATADRDYAAALEAWGLGSVGDEPRAVAERVVAAAVAGPLVAALDDWALCTPDESRRAWLLEVARTADPDDWRDRARSPDAWRDRAQLERLAAEDRAVEQSPQLVTALAMRLNRARGNAADLLRRAQARHPEDFWLNFSLANTLAEIEPADAIGYYRVALAARPDAAVVRNNMGNALRKLRRWPEAMQEFNRAIALDPQFALPHNNLGLALADQDRFDEARAEYEKAAALDRRSALPHHNLGELLLKQGRLDDAKKEYEQAVALDPGLSYPPNGLGIVLARQERLGRAEEEYRTAIRLDPRRPLPHYNLANTLEKQGRLEDAEAEYRKAIELSPRYANARTNLGDALYSQGRLDEAKQEYRAAAALNAATSPRQAAYPLKRLASVLERQGRLEEAREQYRRAIEADPRDQGARGDLADALAEQGRLEEARERWQAYLNSGEVAERLRRHERQLALARRLPAVLRGEDQPPDGAAWLGLAELCTRPPQRLFAAAARFYAAAFAAEPRLADDVPSGNRYGAACAAAQAGCGLGEGAKHLPDRERLMLRRQALQWLRDDLALWARQVESATPDGSVKVRQTLRDWLRDADLAGVRQRAALTRLPEAERDGWEKLWADVTILLKRVSS